MSSGMSSGMTGVSAATTPAADDRKLQGVSRSLIIGVGGTGHKIMLDLRQRLLQKYGSMDKLPIVSFLLLDTDQSIFNKNPNYSDAANLDNADKIHCSVYGVETTAQELCASIPICAIGWTPRHSRATSIRARARSGRADDWPIFWNYDQIAKRIEEEALEITKDSSKAQAIKNGLAGFRGRDGLSGRLAS